MRTGYSIISSQIHVLKIYTPPTKASKEPAHNQLRRRCRKAARGVEAQVEQVEELQHGAAPVHLRQGPGEKRAEGRGQDEDGKAEEALEFRLHVELYADGGQRRRRHGCRDGRDEAESGGDGGQPPSSAERPVLRVRSIVGSIPGNLRVRAQILSAT